jgi:hypothetical protein
MAGWLGLIPNHAMIIIIVMMVTIDS